jgi:transcriptional regulator with XRE-family HTH domain
MLIKNKQHLWNRIEKARKSHGYSLNTFAKMAGVSVAVLSLYGSGGRPLTWDTLFVLAKALNLKLQINMDIP